MRTNAIAEARAPSKDATHPGVDDVPKEIRKLLLKAPSGEGSRSVFASVETKQPEFEVHVLKGKYRFEVDRVVYDAPMEKTWVLGGMEPATPCTAEETTIGRICDFQQDYAGVVRLQELQK